MAFETKKVFIDTLGCQMNKSDTERILGMLSHFDYSPCDKPEGADLMIVNTCAIRQLSQDKAYSRLGYFAKVKREQKNNAKIAICGCVAQLEKESILKKFPYVDLVFGTRNIYELPKLLKDCEERRICAVKEEDIKECDYNIKRESAISAWLPIMDGCDNFCTYCVVPYTRGRERSREMSAIVNEAKKILSQGYREIILLGQNVDSYGKNLEGDINFAKLLRELDNLEGDFRLRFTTSYPTDITDDVIDTVKNSTHICECFHIPMQSGNDRILKEMNRRYNVREYSAIVQKIRNLIPNVTITSDFIAGFPSEAEVEFEDTLRAIEDLELDYSNTASYSPRPFTKAGKMVEDFIPDDVKSDRLSRLNEKVKQMHLRSNQKYINSDMEILIEGFKNDIPYGRTRNNKVTHIKNAKTDIKIGDFVNVKITDVSTWCMFGEILS